MKGSDAPESPAGRCRGSRASTSAPSPTPRKIASAPSTSVARRPRESNADAEPEANTERLERLALGREGVEDAAGTARSPSERCHRPRRARRRRRRRSRAPRARRRRQGHPVPRRSRRRCVRSGSARSRRGRLCGARDVGRVPLQGGDGDRRPALMPQDARSLAEHLDGANASARSAEQILAVDGACCVQCPTVRELAHETRNVDVCWARDDARSRGVRPRAVETAVCLTSASVSPSGGRSSGNRSGTGIPGDSPRPDARPSVVTLIGSQRTPGIARVPLRSRSVEARTPDPRHA